MPRLIVLLLFFITITTSSYAGWVGPAIVIEGGLGSDRSEFGIYQSDTNISLPVLSAVLPNGMIVVMDLINNRQKIYNGDGSLDKLVHYIDLPPEDGMTRKKIPEYALSKITRVTAEGNLYSDSSRIFKVYSSSGEPIETYNKRPLELGALDHRSVGDNNYVSSIRYEDITYIINGHINAFYRDQRDYLYSYGTFTGTDPVSGRDSLASYVNKYDRCGNELGKLDIPASEYEPVTEEEMNSHTGPNWTVRNQYGPPVIGPDGSVYCWKRTPETYNILKWEWVDSSSDPKSDCSK
jgi:hypothetical protein